MSKSINKRRYMCVYATSEYKEQVNESRKKVKVQQNNKNKNSYENK